MPSHDTGREMVRQVNRSAPYTDFSVHEDGPSPSKRARTRLDPAMPSATHGLISSYDYGFGEREQTPSPSVARSRLQGPLYHSAQLDNMSMGSPYGQPYLRNASGSIPQYAHGVQGAPWPSPAGAIHRQSPMPDSRAPAGRAKGPGKAKRRQRFEFSNASAGLGGLEEGPEEEPSPKPLEAPLSVLTAHFGDNPPVRNMQAHVDRSVEERMAYARKRNGNPGRPMNSFMLYRSAYSDRAKALSSTGNHQRVSSLAGESWRIETPEVRAEFERLAEEENANHKFHFPAYKFKPSKSQPRKTKRSREQTPVTPEQVSEASDAEWRPHRVTRSTKRMVPKRPSPRSAAGPKRSNINDILRSSSRELEPHSKSRSARQRRHDVQSAEQTSQQQFADQMSLQQFDFPAPQSPQARQQPWPYSDPSYGAQPMPWYSTAPEHVSISMYDQSTNAGEFATQIAASQDEHGAFREASIAQDATDFHFTQGSMMQGYPALDNLLGPWPNTWSPERLERRDTVATSSPGEQTATDARTMEAFRQGNLGPTSGTATIDPMLITMSPRCRDRDMESPSPFPSLEPDWQF